MVFLECSLAQMVISDPIDMYIMSLIYFKYFVLF